MKLNSTKIYNQIVIIIFLITISLPLIFSIYEKDAKFSRIEKRKLNQMPSITPVDFKKILDFPEKFNNYFSDQFGLRISFVKYYKKLKFFMGDSPSKEITIGKDDWLFLGSINNLKDNNGVINDFRNVNKYSDSQLKKIAMYLEGLQLWLGARNIEYVFFIAPNKHTIYPDKLPESIQKESSESATDQLLDYLKKHTDVKTVDLRKPLFEEKLNRQIYYKKDTHWNYAGANIAQKYLFLELNKIFPNSFDTNIYEMEQRTSYGGDLLGIMGPYIYGKRYKKNEPYPIFNKKCTPKFTPTKYIPRDIHTSVCDDKTLKALVFRDSFFSKLEPYFSRQFNEITYIFEKTSYRPLKKYLAKYKPNIVIEEWVERHLPYVPREYSVFYRFLKSYRFKNSQIVAYKNSWNNIKFTHADPLTTKTKIALNKNKSYVMNFVIQSPVKSKLKIFTNNKQKKLIKNVAIRKGETNILILLENISQNSFISFTPSIKNKVFNMNSLEIRETKHNFTH